MNELAPIAAPLQIDGRGRTAETDTDRHLLDMIENVVFTAQGERVMRPEFGSGLLQLVFAPNSDQLGTTVQFLVNGALNQWLGDLIEVASVAVDQDDSTLRVSIEYIVRATGESVSATLERSV